jgi:hypothetical protein
VVNRYWAAIGAHAFARAYGYAASGAIGSRAGFVASETHEAIESTEFQGRLTALTGQTAPVAVVSLITHDHQYGCRTWSGSYAMIHQAPGRLIDRADITHRPRR